mgnify:CR=1 FL=1
MMKRLKVRREGVSGAGAFSIVRTINELGQALSGPSLENICQHDKEWMILCKMSTRPYFFLRMRKQQALNGLLNNVGRKQSKRDPLNKLVAE